MSVLDAFGLQGRRALVTGGGGGLGRAAAVALAQAGAAVVVAGRTAASLDETVGQVRAGGGTADRQLLDVTDPDQVESAFADPSRPVDILVNSAGIDHEANAVDLEPPAWRQVVETNLSGTFFCARSFARHFRGSSGSIVNIGSIAAAVGISGQSAYTASKGGVEALSRALAVELAPMGIRVNTLDPGYFSTEMPAQFLADPSSYRRLVGRIPLRRVADPAEIGPPVVFLASEASKFVTGAALYVDGGFTAR